MPETTMLATRTCSAGLLLLLAAALPGTFSGSVHYNDCGEGYIRRGTACVRLYSPAKDPTMGTHLTPELQAFLPLAYYKRGEGMFHPFGSPECPEGYTKKGAHCIQIQTNLSSKKVDTAERRVRRNAILLGPCPSGYIKRGPSCVMLRKQEDNNEENEIQTNLSSNLKVDTAEGRVRRQTFLPGLCPPGHIRRGPFCVLLTKQEDHNKENEIQTNLSSNPEVDTAEGRVRRQTFLPGLCSPGHIRRGPFCVLLTKQEDNNKENEIHTNQSSNPEVDTAEGRVRRQTFLPGLCPPGHTRRGPFCVLLTKQKENNKENEIQTNQSSNSEVDTAEGRVRRNAFSINLCPPGYTKKDIYCVIDNQEDKKQ